ncbi:MAG: hypothetical protein HGB29_08765 [Chlorobiaceae bacterium]|nr:hypothetical protein [Chlorobiaceae bacterium]
MTGVDTSPLPVSSPTYTLLIDGDTIPSAEDGQQTVIASSAEEAARFLSLLGGACELVLSPTYHREHPGLHARILELATGLQDLDAPFDTGIAAELMHKLPLDLKGLLRSPIAIASGTPAPPPISKRLVHKRYDENILVSEPCSIGWLRYFNMFLSSGELRFDHESGHVQGMLMIEALRQAGIASAHLQGLPNDGMLALMEYRTNFFSFLECTAPIVLRTYCSFTATETSQDKEACIYLQVMQWGRICAEAHLKAYACMSNQQCQKKEDRIEKIASRHRNLFESKLARMIDKDMAYL